jgi:hypothetical protein
MSNFREGIRLTVTPNIKDHMSDDKRFVPLKSLVGPFSFPIDMFQRRLQVGNQTLGDFAHYESNQMKRAISFNYKKLMDVFVRMFEELFYQADDSKRRIEARYVHLLARTKDREDHSTWIRDQVDLAAAYEKIESFVFFIEVCRRENADNDDPAELNLSDTDDIVQETFVNVRSERRSTGDEMEVKRRRVLATKLQATYNCQQPKVYDCTRDSCDLSAIFTNPVDFGRVILAAVTPVTVQTNRDAKARLCDLEYAPSKVFSAHLAYMASINEGAATGDRMPTEFIKFHEDSRQMCLDLCAGLSFGLEPPQIRLEMFRNVGFPDIRQTEQPDVVPYPDDATLLRAAGLELDNTVQVKGVSAFTSARDKLKPSLRATELYCANPNISTEEKLRFRLNWQERAFILYKSMVYSPRSAVGRSVKAMMREWETETEKDRPCGRVGILIPQVPLEHFPNLDLQQNYLANLYVFAEKAGVFCQHSNFLGMLIDSRYACRKGSGMKSPPPHTILFGSPGSGKSYCLEMAKFCIQGESYAVFAKWVDSTSALSWAVVNDEEPDNPDTTQTQIAIMWDEVPAQKLGAGGDKKRGEGSDEVCRTKSMCTKSSLDFQRNTEIKRADGTTGRGLEEASITNECVFLGGMNRPPYDVNPAFLRRFMFKAALTHKRADDKTLADAKAKADEQDPKVEEMVMALRCNARIHLVVAGAEYDGIIKEPCLKAFDILSARFEAEVKAVTSVNHFTDRLANARERLRLFTRMVAVFETYQTFDQPQVMSFGALVSKLPEVERRSVAGERITLAMLSSLEDMIFPLMHKIVLQSIKQRWGDDQGVLDELRADGFKNQNPGRYAKLPIDKKNAYRQKKDESVADCGVRVLMAEVATIIDKAAGAYEMNGTKELAKAAVLELTAICDPEYPVICFEEEQASDDGGAGVGGDVLIYVSLTRLATLDVTLADIIKKLAKPGGTQLTMIPHRVPETIAILPQFPIAFDDGLATIDDESLDNRHFKERCAKIFQNEDEAYHPTRSKAPTTNHQFPKTIIATLPVV